MNVLFDMMIRFGIVFTLPDYNILVSNPTLIQSLGYKPKVDFYGLADIMLKEMA